MSGRATHFCLGPKNQILRDTIAKPSEELLPRPAATASPSPLPPPLPRTLQTAFHYPGLPYSCTETTFATFLAFPGRLRSAGEEGREGDK